jgi:hypothetical protein
MEVEFFTVTHRIVGKLDVGIRRLSDVLNGTAEVSLELEEARVSSFAEDELPSMVEFVHIFKEGILIAIPRGGEPERPLEHREKVQHRVQLSMPPFSVSGDLHLVRDVRLRKALSEITPVFLPLTRVQIVHTLQPSLTWSPPAAIFNRRRAGYFRPATG